MVAGTPNDVTMRIAGLTNLYYPDHADLPEEQEDIVRRYNAHDALHYRYTHGLDVTNKVLPLKLPTETMARTTENSDGVIAISVIHLGGNERWTDICPDPGLLSKTTIRISGLEVGSEWRACWSSPDSLGSLFPEITSSYWNGGELVVEIPALHYHGVLLLRPAGKGNTWMVR